MRAPLKAPLTRAEAAVALLVANGHADADVADQLGHSLNTARFHIKNAAKKIPGDLPAKMKVICWVRGAPLQVLNGTWTNDNMEELVQPALSV